MLYYRFNKIIIRFKLREFSRIYVNLIYPRDLNPLDINFITNQVYYHYNQPRNHNTSFNYH